MPRGADTRARRAALLGAAALSLALCTTQARAQRPEPPLPPRIDRNAEPPRAPAQAPRQSSREPAPRGELLLEITPRDLAEANAQPAPSTIDTFARPPNAARLAPLPEERKVEGVEEIVVLGGNWRIPDLGSRWRARQEAAEAAAAGEPHVTFLPLYDPERPTTFNNTFLLNREMERIGYIDIFRLRFGKRSKPDAEE